ncbi:class I SAM-dependent methyltransferase [Undibacterium parvum]|uniref:Class I SAM-dependent methyltransferase n=2 Tax=Undibacterium TaxID=401469 RepID=A0A6M4A293_9BURK|nr:class I SAM-dependent methyltransferase [Undibacterium parvum]AZP10662.1 class I SAM-dependent methyltransferase [Undibacterium parvum]QJQ05284.1 class I SAM-dependent methyltransferase [Undibacterium piscinae]
MREVMSKYYAQRADTYESIYQRPERQKDLLEIEQRVNHALEQHKVLEVACGTGYWTERFAPAAQSVVATDINQSMLDIAATKKYPSDRVQFGLADVFALPASTQGQYSACFAGFFWSHVKREEQADVLAQFSRAAGKGSFLVMIDNNYVEGSSTVIARTDLEGNTHQFRMQEDGARVEVVKNFPTDSFLRKRIGLAARDIRIFRNQYFWMLTCVLK